MWRSLVKNIEAIFVVEKLDTQLQYYSTKVATIIL